MKTRIIIKSGWIVIAEYPFLLTLSNNDVVENNGVEYRVDCCVLNVAESTMEILISN